MNGIGEASHADFGITGAKNEGLIFAHGEPLRKVPQSELVDALFEEIDKSVGRDGEVEFDEREASVGAVATSYRYDGLGNLTSLIDPNGNAWMSEYDQAGRRTSRRGLSRLAPHSSRGYLLQPQAAGDSLRGSATNRTKPWLASSARDHMGQARRA